MEPTEYQANKACIEVATQSIKIYKVGTVYVYPHSFVSYLLLVHILVNVVTSTHECMFVLAHA